MSLFVCVTGAYIIPSNLRGKTNVNYINNNNKKKSKVAAAWSELLRVHSAEPNDRVAWWQSEDANLIARETQQNTRWCGEHLVAFDSQMLEWVDMSKASQQYLNNRNLMMYSFNFCDPNWRALKGPAIVFSITQLWCFGSLSCFPHSADASLLPTTSPARCRCVPCAALLCGSWGPKLLSVTKEGFIMG